MRQQQIIRSGQKVQLVASDGSFQVGAEGVAMKNGLGGVRQSKRIKYGDHTLGSTYEVRMAQSLDKNSIEWTTCPRFKYRDISGKERSYTPDFYLPAFNVYLDPKNDFLLNNVNPSLGFTDRDKIKWAMEQNDIHVIILSEQELSWDFLKTKLLD